MNVSFYQKYHDVMDPSRHVVPMQKGSQKGYLDCRVYFDGCFVGKTEISESLLTNEVIGFRLQLKTRVVAAIGSCTDYSDCRGCRFKSCPRA